MPNRSKSPLTADVYVCSAVPSNPALAKEISAYLGVPDGPRVCKRFADGELYVQIQESIRGCDVFLISHTARR